MWDSSLLSIWMFFSCILTASMSLPTSAPGRRLLLASSLREAAQIPFFAAQLFDQ
jgi:hypothetical protein